MKRVVFVSDFFSTQGLHGAESNDSVLIEALRQKGYSVIGIPSQLATLKMCKSFSEDDVYIISNFVFLNEESKSYIQSKNYIIYEHDHKYVNTRDPSRFKDFKIPEKRIINLQFYQNAKAVVVLSDICKRVIEDNLKISNVYSIGTSLWPKETFEVLRHLVSTQDKEKEVAIVKSDNPTKGMAAAIRFCKKAEIEYDLISSANPRDFLTTLSLYKKVVFIPQVLETFCRLVAEASMLDCKVYTKSKMIGFMSEEYSSLRGLQLIGVLEQKVDEALQLFCTLLEEK